MVDKCVSDNDYVGTLISKNNDLHQFGETKEEFFIGIVRELVVSLQGGPLTSAAHQDLWAKAKVKHTTHGDVVSQKPIVEMVLAAWPMLKYYAKTRIFRLPYLYTWIGVGGSVSH